MDKEIEDSINKEIERAIRFLASCIKAGVSGDEAMKYSQAALNLVNALARIDSE